MQKVKFNKSKKQLTVDLSDVALVTPFQKQVIAEMLTAVFRVMDSQEPVFEYFKEKDSWGYRTQVKKNA
jgi:hypothetical protein